MPQLHIDKNRSYRLGKGNALDAFNERLAENESDKTGLVFLHATKGFRSFSPRRLAAMTMVESMMHAWAQKAAHITHSSVGGNRQERIRPGRSDGNGAREAERRRAQAAKSRAA